MRSEAYVLICQLLEVKTSPEICMHFQLCLYPVSAQVIKLWKVD